MLTFVARVRCPLCSYEFSIRDSVGDKVEADIKTDSNRIMTVRCPSHGGPLRLAGSVLRIEEPSPALLGENLPKRIEESGVR